MDDFEIDINIFKKSFYYFLSRNKICYENPKSIDDVNIKGFIFTVKNFDQSCQMRNED